MSREAGRVRLGKRDRDAIAGMNRRLDAKMTRLRSVVPHILDLSVLEGRLPAPRGHTLGDRIELYRLAREFGFDELALFSFFDFRNVDTQSSNGSWSGNGTWTACSRPSPLWA